MADSSPPLREYIGLLQRQAWLILLVPILTAVAAAAVVSQQKPVYRASMGIIVAQGGGESRPEIGNRPLTQTMTNILESDVIAKAVVSDLKLDATSAKLLKKLHVLVKPDSSILNVTYDSPDKRQAVVVLAALGREFLALTREKLGVTNSLSRPGPLLIIADIYDPPHVEADLVSPHRGTTIAFAFATGLALGLILAFARQSLDDRLRSREDVEEWFGAPVIGTLPRGLIGRPPAFVRDGRRGAEKRIEALHSLRANLQFASTGIGAPTLITSALPSEGKTTVVASLSMALALAGNNVIAVETDRRSPMLHVLLGVPTPSRGLMDVVEGRAAIADTLQEIPLVQASRNGAGARAANASQQKGRLVAGRLRLLAVGSSTVDPTTPLSTERVAKLVSKLGEMADFVILDSPALLSASEALDLVVGVNRVIVVARQGRTTRERANGVRTMLRRVGVTNVGIVLVDAREPLREFDA